MLSEEQVSSYIDALIRLDVLHDVPGHEMEDPNVRFKIKSKGIIGRILGGEFGEPPADVEVVPWFSCMLLKTILVEKNVTVSKEEFTGMAAIIMGFLTEPAITRKLRSGDGGLVVGRSRERRGKAGRRRVSS